VALHFAQVSAQNRGANLGHQADGERVEEFVPAFGSFFQVGGLRITLQPLVQFYGHRREELSLVNLIAQMVTIGAAPGVPGWPDLDGRHKLADGGYDLLGNALGLFRSRPALFETGVQLL
jgi:hypothetical protein